ncbi:MAG: hypothetical protein ABIJ34_04465 [archaeon]
MKHTIILVLFILLLPVLHGAGSIQTVALNPATVNLCGEYQQYVTITPSQVINKENLSLLSVTAKLFIVGSPGLSFVTSEAVNLGNILPLTQSMSNPSWTLQCNTPISGNYAAYINYTTTNGYAGSSLDEAVSILTVHDSGFFISNISVTQVAFGGEVQPNLISDSKPTIKVSTNRNAICKGSLDLDETYENMDFMFYGSGLVHNYTFISKVSDGQHRVYARCMDEQSNVMQISQVISFEIDTARPIISLLDPEPVIVGDIADLKIIVNEKSVCRYDRDDDSFENMRDFGIVSGNQFTEHITDLEEKTYTYYIECKDKVGNSQRIELNFEVQLPPTARIVWEKNPPLSKDTYKLTLIPSRPLESVPSLFYKFTDDDSFLREITLVKEGTHFEGYIIIDDQDKTRSGVLVFRGIDLLGNEGTEITEGSAFLVDTVKPAPPADANIKAAEDGIRLSWYYDGEKPDHFNVYRSETAGVSPIHFYDSVKAEEFLDDNILTNNVYYYRIAAVDIAGNVGAFSKELSAYAISGNAQTTSTPVAVTNPPTLDTRDWKTRTEKDIETLLIDLDWAQNNLREQATKESLVEELSLIKQVTDAASEINKLGNQLKAQDILRITDSDLRDTLSKGDALLARTRKLVPESLEVVKSTDIVQATSSSDIELATHELLIFRKSNFSDGQIKSYINQMAKINSNIKVENSIKTIAIKSIDGTTKNQVIVKKKFSYDMPEKLSNVLAVEVIPKTVAGDVSDIDIWTPDYLVINPDPVLAWGYDSISFDKITLSYAVLANDDSESAKTAKTIILVDPDIVMQQQSNLITGFSVLLSKAKGMPILGIIAGIIIIAGLSVYYFTMINDTTLGNLKFPELLVWKKQPSEPRAISNDFKNKIAEMRPKYASLIESPLKTSPEKYFHLKNGDIIRNITEASVVLRNTDDFTFRYHVSQSANDFAVWLEDALHAGELAMIVRNAGTKDELIEIFDEFYEVGRDYNE